MAGQPLSPATDHCLGEPLPRQLANRARAPPETPLRALSPKTEVLGMSCGISPPFDGLFPIPGQVAHVLRTRPPRENLLYCYRKSLVRLACVKHAASVRSEPGSNSRLNLVALKIKMSDLPCETPDPDLQCELFVARFTHSNRTGSGMSSDCQRAGPPVQQLGVQAIKKYSEIVRGCQPRFSHKQRGCPAGHPKVAHGAEPHDESLLGLAKTIAAQVHFG